MPISNGHSRDGAKLVHAGEDVFPDRSVKIVLVPHVVLPIPAILTPEPGSPRSRGVRVQLCEELSEESGVLGLNRKDAQATKFFGGADVGPGNLALPTIAVFVPSPEKGAPPLVNGLNDASWKKASAHGVGEHRSKDRVNKKETPPNREAPAAPTREPHVTLGHDGREVCEAEFKRR